MWNLTSIITFLTPCLTLVLNIGYLIKALWVTELTYGGTKRHFMVRKRLKIISRDGIIFRDKQEALDHIVMLELAKKPIHGIEIVYLTNDSVESDMYKIMWFQDQVDIYSRAKTFISEKMGGKWNYAEFK